MFTGRITSGEESLAIASLQRDECSGEREKPEDDEQLVQSLLCDVQSLRLGKGDFEVLDLLDFGLFGARDRREKQFSFLLLRFLELSRFGVVLNFSIPSNDDLLGEKRISFLSTFPVSTYSCVKRDCE